MEKILRMGVTFWERFIVWTFLLFLGRQYTSIVTFIHIFM